MALVLADRAAAAVVLAVLASSCTRRDVTATDPGQPASPPAHPVVAPGRLIPTSPLSIEAEPGTPLYPPSVRVTDSTAAIPIAGVRVTFTITSGGGAIGDSVVSSGVDGSASVGYWRLGNAPGSGTLVASVPGLASVTFTATLRFRVPIAIYDLQMIGGKALPVALGNSATITAGHYVLFDDGSCTWGWELNGQIPASPDGCIFERSDSTTIDFLEGVQNFATGTVSGTHMTVKYRSDWGQAEEVYVRRSPGP